MRTSPGRESPSTSIFSMVVSCKFFLKNGTRIAVSCWTEEEEKVLPLLLLELLFVEASLSNGLFRGTERVINSLMVSMNVLVFLLSFYAIDAARIRWISV